MLAANFMNSAGALGPDATLKDALGLLAGEVGAVPVTDSEGSLLGVVTLRAIIRVVSPAGGSTPLSPEEVFKRLNGLESRPASEFAKLDPVIVGPEAGAGEVMALFSGHDTGCVVVADPDRRPLGVITPEDLFKRLCLYLEKKKDK